MTMAGASLSVAEELALFFALRTAAEIIRLNAVIVVKSSRAFTLIRDALRRPIFFGVPGETAAALVVGRMVRASTDQQRNNDEQPPTHSHHLLAEVTA